jgi:[acyl-carrier-protein] S-malonyltransferase
MGAPLCAASAAAREIFALADRVTGLPVTDICTTGTLEELTRTEYTQLSVVTTSLAAAACLEEQLGRRPEVRGAAGHSVGELAAMAWAGAVSYQDALQLVAERGRLMAEASSRVDGTMAAVIGLTAEQLEAICAAASTAGGLVQVANLNAPDQVVLSGQRQAVEEASSRAREAGASRVLPLAVSGPFHSAYMGDAAAAFAKLCASVSFSDARCPIVLNTSARPESAAQALAAELAAQIPIAVRWSESLQKLSAMGCDTFVEIGPGRVLSGLVRRTLPGADTLAAGSPEAMEPLLALWRTE